jgi:WD40 repeat protein
VICWSSDGRRLVTSASDHLIRLWDAMSGEVLFTFTGHTDKVNGVTWNPDDTLLASTSFDGTLRLWDALVPSEGRVLVAAKASGVEGGAYCVSWSPVGTLLAACLRFVQEVSIRIWNVGDQSPSSVSCHDMKFELKYHILLGRTLNVASQLSWNPRSTSLVAAIGAGIAVWSLESASLEYSVSDPHGSLSIGCVDWSLDGRAIVAGGVDGYVRVFRADNGALVARLSGHDQTITGCMWSKDSRHIASCSMDSRVIVWDSLLV